MRFRRAAIVTAVVSVAMVLAGIPVYVRPATDTVSAADPADAVVALGGIPYTATYAAELFHRGAARQLVISDAYPPGYPTMVQLCPPQPPPGVTCFRPDPFTTRGEAREIGQLARANGWHDVIVVAPTFHISRARFIIKRCYSGRLRMVDPHAAFPARLWPYNYVYQTTGFIKALFLPGC